jgi:hypothetical protein
MTAPTFEFWPFEYRYVAALIQRGLKTLKWSELYLVQTKENHNQDNTARMPVKQAYRFRKI